MLNLDCPNFEYEFVVLKPWLLNVVSDDVLRMVESHSECQWMWILNH